MRCPWCGQHARRPSAYDLVVEGDGDTKAPRLTKAWYLTSGLLMIRHREEPALEFAKSVAQATGVAESSVRNLILAGQRAGLIEVRHRRGGEPRRVRAYIRWTT